MAGNFAFSAETFPDSPFLRTEVRLEVHLCFSATGLSSSRPLLVLTLKFCALSQLLELEADCVVVQRQSAKISKGLTAYL